MKNNNFWNVKTDGKKTRIDLFGYVGGSKEYNDGFNEKEFLDEFRAIPAENDIDITINSFGGSVFTGLAIYELLKSHKGNITFSVAGCAMSAATIITSVPNAKVIMPKGSIMMIHKVSSIAMGNAEDLRKAADTMDKLEDNIINIYAEKTGKPVDEIKPLVDAETYFTAQEAVDFGLADELDEAQTVENVAAEKDYVMVNGLKVDAKYFEHAPKSFFNRADTQENASAGLSPNNKKEAKAMDFETLKAEHPEIVEAIRAEALKEGAEKERARIQAIEEIAVSGHEEMVLSAKFENPITVEQLAVAILKADKARDAKHLVNRVKDAAELADVTSTAGNDGIIPGAENKQKEDAERAEIIAAGKKAFSR